MIGFAAVERALRQRTFGTLSTLTERGTPHATGVMYAVSVRDEPLALYVTTRTTTRKVRNIRARQDVAFVVPVPHRLVPMFPPRAIQFLGTAAVVPADDEGANRALSRRGSSAGSLPRSGAS
jgi:nitroimidazol reductase NimA-like FMN-containing flavoprotein (pyridoxamine 5'-phosphate oxidase superfamily)